MVAITPTDMSVAGVRTAVETTMTASDTLAYDPGKPGSILSLRNPTAGALSPVIVGSLAPAALPVNRVGFINLSAGLAVGSIPAGQRREIRLDSVAEYLAGNVTITGGTGLVATFLQ